MKVRDLGGSKNSPSSNPRHSISTPPVVPNLGSEGTTGRQTGMEELHDMHCMEHPTEVERPYRLSPRYPCSVL